MSSLQDAHEALQQNNLDQVQKITADLLKANPDNADAWYLLSQAVEGERQELFMQKAMALDPDVVGKYEMQSGDMNLADELFDFESSSLSDEIELLDEDDFGLLDDLDDQDEPNDDFVDDGFYVEPDDDSVEVSVTDNEDAVENDSRSSLDMNLILLIGLVLAFILMLILFAQALLS